MKIPANRPDGISSRVRLAEGSRNKWVARNGQTVDLPLIVDLVEIHPGSGECTFFTEVRIELVSGQPQLVDTHLIGMPCLDPVKLQRFFRWATPIEIVRKTIPALLKKGIDPYSYEYAVDGYPDAAQIDRKLINRLSDDFLEEVVRQYLEVGRGYARIIAQQRGVSERTVVSWVQKARKRGILSATKPGKRGGKLLTSGRHDRKSLQQKNK